MSETKFTKGEWVVKTSQNASIKLVTHAIGNGRMSLPEGIANAHLIAAAPEMYAMLEDLAVSMECFHGVDTDSIYKLLTKARGETK